MCFLIFISVVVLEMAWIFGEDQRNALKAQDIQFWYIVA